MISTYASFYRWMLAQRDRPSMTGDIARKLKHDKKFPWRYAPDVQHDYLKRAGYSTFDIEAYKRAWHTYLREYCFEEKNVRSDRQEMFRRI